MKVNHWNIIFAAIVTAFLGCLGYLLTSISELQKKEASREALEFTAKDAAILQQRLTDVMTDIDLRISLIERDIQWVKIIQPRTVITSDQASAPGPPIPPSLDPPSPDPANFDLSDIIPRIPYRTPEATPRYDLRRKTKEE